MKDKFHIETPVFESRILSNLMRKKVLLKMECFQPTGSFKIRGIGKLCQELVSKGCRKLVASSGGNAGYAVAYAANKLNIPTTIFVPETSSSVYLRVLESMNVEIKITGSVWDETHKKAMEYVDKSGAAYVPPFDHPTIWAGNSTIVDEIVNQCHKPDVIVAAVGGGGLLCGILEGLQRHNCLDVKLISAETIGADSFAKSLYNNKLITLDKVTSIATSLGAKTVSKKLFDWSRKKEIVPYVVPDQYAIDACLKFVDDHRVLVEPACGAALSLIYSAASNEIIEQADSILIIVCGGVGASLEQLNKWKAEGLSLGSS